MQLALLRISCSCRQSPATPNCSWSSRVRKKSEATVDDATIESRRSLSRIVIARRPRQTNQSCDADPPKSFFRNLLEAPLIEAAQQFDAFVRFLHRLPVPTTAQHLDLAAGDPLAEGAHRLRRGEDVLCAGPQPRRAGEA